MHSVHAKLGKHLPLVPYSTALPLAFMLLGATQCRTCSSFEMCCGKTYSSFWRIKRRSSSNW